MTPRTEGSTSWAPSLSPRTSRSRPGSPSRPRTVTSRSTGAPVPERSTSATTSSRTRPDAPATESNSGNRSGVREGVGTTPVPGSHTSQWMWERSPGGWTVMAARPCTLKNPSAGRARRGAGRAASSSEADVVGGHAAGAFLGQGGAGQAPNGATVTATRPRRSHRLTTAAGGWRTRTSPCPCPVRATPATG